MNKIKDFLHRSHFALLVATLVLLPWFGGAIPATAATVNLKVLVISTGTAAQDPGLVLMTDLLDQMRVPYDVLNSGNTTLTASRLISGTTGKYNGIILTDSELYLPAGGSGFTLAEWQILHAYERDFGVREAVVSGFPGTDASLDLNYGMTNIQGGVPYNGIWQAPAGGTEIFEYVNTANPLPISDWAFSGQPTAGGPTVTPLLVRQDDASQTLVSVLAYPDGRQVLLCTIANAWWLTHSEVLAYEFLNFATQGVFLGARKVYLEAHVDDVFGETGLWNAAANVTDENNAYRMTEADLNNVVTMQRNAVRAHPALPLFQLDFAFNGEGTDKETDPLTQAVVDKREKFRFINHTWTHLDMDVSAGTTYSQARTDIANNLTVWRNLEFLNYSAGRRVLVTGGYSGLWDDMGTELDPSDDIPYPQGKNNAFLRAAQDLGVRYLGSDASRVNQNVESYVPGFNLLLLPRWPTSVFYNTTTPEMLTDEYNYIFYERYLEMGQNPCLVAGAICFPRTYAEILGAEADTTLRQMLSYKMWPHFFHQANLMRYDDAGSTLQFDWLNAVVSRYEQVMTLPIVNLGYDEIGPATARRVDATGATVNARLDTATNRITLSANRTVWLLTTGFAVGQDYGGQRLGEVQVGTQTRTFNVDRALTR